MPNVWYIGGSVRRISKRAWAEHGINADSVTWNSYNGWSLPHSMFNFDQLNILENDNEFLLGQDGPRVLPQPQTLDEFYKSGYVYYARILEFWNSLLTVHPGIIGPQGPEGPDGPQGEEGPEGPQGYTGLQGDAGGAGPRGSSRPPYIRFSSSIAMMGVTATDRAYVNRQITGARVRVASAPLGSPFTAEIESYNGSWETVGEIEIDQGSVIEGVTELDYAQTAGSLLRLNITSIGSTSAATGVAVDVLVTSSSEDEEGFPDPPETATSSGIAGQEAFDSNYKYVCVATNTWKRTALGTW